MYLILVIALCLWSSVTLYIHSALYLGLNMELSFNFQKGQILIKNDQIYLIFEKLHFCFRQAVGFLKLLMMQHTSMTNERTQPVSQVD